MKKKEFYYVLVFTTTGAKFVTGLEDHHFAKWDELEPPMAFSKSNAISISAGLVANGFNSVMCELRCFDGSMLEIDYQPYNYKGYKCEFVPREED